MVQTSLSEQFKQHVVSMSKLSPVIQAEQEAPPVMTVRSSPPPKTPKMRITTARKAKVTYHVPNEAEIYRSENENDIVMNNIESQTETNGEKIGEIKHQIEELRQQVLDLTGNVQKNDINSSTWLERRHHLLKDIPTLTEQNKKLRENNNKYSSHLYLLNDRINDLVLKRKSDSEKITNLEA